jgi:hypothetical protein
MKSVFGLMKTKRRVFVFRRKSVRNSTRGKFPPTYTQTDELLRMQLLRSHFHSLHFLRRGNYDRRETFTRMREPFNTDPLTHIHSKGQLVERFVDICMGNIACCSMDP